MTTNQPPTEQDKELREQVNKLLDFFTEPGTGEKYLKDLENDLVELIQSHIDKAAQEAYKNGYVDGGIAVARMEDSDDS